MQTTFAEPGIIITIQEEKGSNYYDEELAKALVEIWRARHSWTPEQRERIIAITKESYLDHGK